MDNLHRGKRTSDSQCRGEENYQAKSRTQATSLRCQVGPSGCLGSQHGKVQPSVWADIVSRRDGPDPLEATDTT